MEASMVSHGRAELTKWTGVLLLAGVGPASLHAQTNEPSFRTSWSFGAELGTLPDRSDLFASVRIEPVHRNGMGFTFLWSWHPPGTSAEGPDGLFEVGFVRPTLLARSATVIPRIVLSALGDGGGGGIGFTAGPGVGAGLVLQRGSARIRVDYSLRYFIEPLGIYEGGFAHGVALGLMTGGWGR